MPSLRASLLPVAFSTAAVAAATILSLSGPASAQEGGDDGAPEYREDGPYLLVCTGDSGDFTDRNDELSTNRRFANLDLHEECLADGYRDLPSAISAAEPGTRIMILPGHYSAEEAIVIDGVEDLQIEGLGDEPGDIHLSAQFQSGTVLEARNSTGLYLRGFSVRRGSDTGLLLGGVDGVVVDAVSGVHNGQTGIRVADSSAVWIRDCAAGGNDTAGIASSDSQVEISGCESSENLVGLLATGTGEVRLDANRLHDNTTGLVVTDTRDGHALTAENNLVYDNNADYYRYLSGGECAAPLTERNWSEGVLCPAETTPTGVGVLISGANDNTFRDNRIWGQRTAAAMVWGDGVLNDEVSHRNRFEGNALGYNDDGRRSRNDLDLWWDGQGQDNCFEEPGALHTTPAALPACDAALSPNRLLGEPVRTLKAWQCGTGALVEDAVPEGCDWFGATLTDRLEFQTQVLFAAALLFLTGAGWLAASRSPDPPPPMSMTFSAIATGSAALLLILASWSGRSDYEALAIGLWGVGWLLAGRTWFKSGLHAFGGFTVLIAGLVVLDAVDRGVRMIPIVPVAPAWMWLILLPLWLALAVIALLWPRRPEPELVPVTRQRGGPEASVPSYNSFQW